MNLEVVFRLLVSFHCLCYAVGYRADGITTAFLVMLVLRLYLLVVHPQNFNKLN